MFICWPSQKAQSPVAKAACNSGVFEFRSICCEHSVISNPRTKNIFGDEVRSINLKIEWITGEYSWVTLNQFCSTDAGREASYQYGKRKGLLERPEWKLVVPDNTTETKRAGNDTFGPNKKRKV